MAEQNEKLQSVHAAIKELAVWNETEPPGAVKHAIADLTQYCIKNVPTGADRGWRPPAGFAQRVFALCKACDGAGIWPNGLLELIQLALDVPSTVTFDIDGELAEGWTPQMRAVLDYWRRHPDATPSEVGRNVKNSRGKPLGATGVRQLLDPKRHPGFAERVEQVRADARAKRKAAARAKRQAKASRKADAATPTQSDR